MAVLSREDESAERRHLAETIRLLHVALDRLDRSIDDSATTIDGYKTHLWTNKTDMDGAEKANLRTAVDSLITAGDHAVLSRHRVKRLIDSPYFGRVDFQDGGARSAENYYIGVGNFWHPDAKRIVIHDWRAPVSSLYYDFESGEAEFETPLGVRDGRITGKRQYKISSGALEYMFESALNIGDEVLQRELSNPTDDRMKNIVATIQREQNAVIRNETAEVLILQGVAGSGKTSIALHRVAFLLYRFKDTLSSDNVMILSPNRVFGDYIANVLPELGEEKVAEIDVDTIAGRFLAKLLDYERFSDQVTGLLENPSVGVTERIRFKATPEFVGLLDEWISSRASDEFLPGEIRQRGCVLGSDWVAESFRGFPESPIFTRLASLANTAIHSLKYMVVDRGGKWTAADAAAVRKQVQSMFPYKDSLAIYKAFYSKNSRQHLIKAPGRRMIEYADVFPLIYTIITTTRHETYGHIRHLVVDEMQDYTPIQYAVLRKLFSCKMTILGDSNQSVNPFSSSSLPTIRHVFPEADCLELHKSYRSTAEITEFAQRISPNDTLVPIARPGRLPGVIACEDEEHETSEILALIERYTRGRHRSLGIICKTVARAKLLHDRVCAQGVSATLLDYDSSAFSGGIVITSAHLSKGLEFDAVIVPGVTDANYLNDMDKCMLYIACTRAIHELDLTHAGPRSTLLGGPPVPNLPVATGGRRPTFWA